MKTTEYTTGPATNCTFAWGSRLKMAMQWMIAILLLAGPALQSQAQTYGLTNIWYAPTNAVSASNIILNGDNNRGLAYDANSNQVFVVSKGGGSPAPGIEVLDGTTGSFLGLLDKTIVTTSATTFPLNQIGVAADGVIYAANLQSPAGPAALTKIYRWTNWLSVATVAFAANAISNTVTPYTIPTASGQRVGDSMAVSGSGANTIIVMPVSTSSPTISTNFIIFTTSDGLNFTNHILNVSGFTAAGSGICGITFYTNNTFLVRTSGGAANNVFLIQFPANIASLDQGPIAGTQLGSFSLPNVLSTTAFISSSGAAGGLFAVASPQNSAGGSAQVALYVDPVAGNGACSLQQATTNYSHPAANGNLAGAVVLDGVHNRIYSLDCNNGVRCTGISIISPQPPTISTQPVGATAYVPYTLSVTAAGYCPLIYQWQATNNAGGFTNIPGATSSSFSVTAASTNFYRVVITNTINPGVTSSVVKVTGQLPVTNAAVAQLWRAAAGSLGFLSSSDNNGRGIAYDTNSDRVVVAVSSASAPTLNILSGTYGTNIGTMGVTGLTLNGTFAVDQVGIADDGAVYGCNLAYNSSIVINRWNSPSVGTNPIAAFNGSAGGPAERYGDNLAVRGMGTNTQILIPSSLNPGLGVGSGTNVVLLTTADGTNFTSTLLGIAGVPGGFANSGIAFDTGNNFWAKSYNGDLFKIAFDPVTGTGSVVFDYSSSGQVPQTTMGLGIDPNLNFMATIVQSDTPDDVQLFQLTGTTAAPVLFHQALMSNNGNANANAAIVMKNKRLYALDVNNGVVALSYGAPACTPPSIVSSPASATAFTNTTVNLTVSASGTLTLNYQWRFNSNNISGAPNSPVYSLTNPTVSKAGYYDVIAQNTCGSITSAPALLTVKIPVLSPVVTQVWTLEPGSRSYLDSSTYGTRGLAYDPLLTNLLVADHFSIHVLNAANNTDLGTLNMVGIANVGFSQWLVDQIRVDDAGVVYAANLQDNSFGSAPLSIVSFPNSSPGTAASQYAWGAGTGADPSGQGWRLGDTLAVRGSGADAQLLMGTPDANGVILFTNDGSGIFAATVIIVTNAPTGFASGGVAFGASNTFWAKGGSGYNLRQVTYDLSNPTSAAVTTVFTAGTQVPSTMTGIGVDVTNNIMAGVSFSDSPNDLLLYLLSGNSNAPYLFDQAFFPGPFGNIQLISATDIKFPWAFGLDVNNGIVALNYGIPAAPAVKLTSVDYAPGSVTINWNNIFVGHGYQLQYKDSLLDSSWTNLGSPVVTANPIASYLDTTANGATRFYRVITQ